ncbi:MAG: phosphohistidine phosphatase SixA [Gammaproteobacteria bacterium]
MKVLLAQHGEATSKEEDPDRPLTEQGREDVERVAAFLGNAGVSAVRALHSGKTRARQTADILTRRLRTGSDPELHPGLGPNDPVEPLAREIGHWDESTLVVGHLPFVALLTGQLVTGHSAVAVNSYRPGAVACLEKTPTGGWAITWMIRPDLLVVSPSPAGRRY